MHVLLIQSLFLDFGSTVLIINIQATTSHLINTVFLCNILSQNNMYII